MFLDILVTTSEIFIDSWMCQNIDFIVFGALERESRKS